MDLLECDFDCNYEFGTACKDCNDVFWLKGCIQVSEGNIIKEVNFNIEKSTDIKLILSNLNPDLFVIDKQAYHPLKGVVTVQDRLSLYQYFELVKSTELPSAKSIAENKYNVLANNYAIDLYLVISKLFPELNQEIK